MFPGESAPREVGIARCQLKDAGGYPNQSSGYEVSSKGQCFRMIRGAYHVRQHSLENYFSTVSGAEHILAKNCGFDDDN